MLGVAWASRSPRRAVGRLLAYLGGAVLGAAYLTLVVGAQLAPGASIGGMFQATSDSWSEPTSTWWFAAAPRPSRSATSCSCWGSFAGGGQFAGYSAYAHRRPVAAVVLPGSLLLANIALTVQDQYALMVVYSIAALLFLVRFHVADEQRAWLRHRIGDVETPPASPCAPA